MLVKHELKASRSMLENFDESDLILLRKQLVGGSSPLSGTTYPSSKIQYGPISSENT